MLWVMELWVTGLFWYLQSNQIQIYGVSSTEDTHNS